MTNSQHQKLTGAAVLAAGAVLFCSACGRTGKVEAESPGSAAAGVPTVAVARATTEDLSHGLRLTAEFKPFQEVDLMAKVAGFVKQINVDVGDRVKQGQLLATLEIPEMTDDIVRAQAALDRANAEVARARDELKRTESSHNIAHLSYTRLDGVLKKKPGLIAQQEIDDAQGRDLVAEAQVSAAKSNLTAATQQVQVNQAELKRVQTMFEYSRVTAPFAGVVTRRFADTGSMIQAGTASQTQAMPVIKLSQNSLLRLILPVPESAVPTVRIGQQVDVRVPTLGRTFPGRVARFSDKLSTSTRTMDTEVDVPNPNLVLVPGMYAEVDLTLARHNAVLTVPVTAVDMASGESKGPAKGHVMVITPNNRVEPREVSLGLETSSKIEVTGGLNEGDLVVIGNRAGLQSGQEVKAKVTELTASTT